MLKTTNEINVRIRSVVLIIGDGWCLPGDMAQFFRLSPERHDVFAVNRAINYYNHCKHWGAADGDEAVYQATQLKMQHPGLCRHTLMPEIPGFDVFWEPHDKPAEDWRGNAGLFAAEACVGMGYKKIVLAGVPMDNNGHWYDPLLKGPVWKEDAYKRWKIFKETLSPVRSMSGWTKKLFKGPTEKWLKS